MHGSVSECFLYLPLCGRVQDYDDSILFSFFLSYGLPRSGSAFLFHIHVVCISVVSVKFFALFYWKAALCLALVRLGISDYYEIFYYLVWGC